MAGLNEVVIIAGCRTPIGKFQGSLSDMSASQLHLSFSANLLSCQRIGQQILRFAQDDNSNLARDSTRHYQPHCSTL